MLQSPVLLFALVLCSNIQTNVFWKYEHIILHLLQHLGFHINDKTKAEVSVTLLCTHFI